MKAIKGFDGYYIDIDNKTVYKTKNNQLLPARVDPARGYVSIYSKEDKKQYFYHLPRIIFATLNDIDIRKIPSSIRITLDGKGNPYIVDNNIQFIKHPYKGTDNIIKDLQEQIRLANLLLESYESGNYTEIINEFYNEIPYIKKYIAQNGYAYNETNINYLIDEAIDRILNCLINKRLRVSNIRNTFRYIIRTIAKKRLKIKKQIYNDKLFYNDCREYNSVDK